MSKLRFIKHTSLRLNDVVRIHAKYLDLDVTRVGVVAKREHYGRTTVYTSPQGAVILQVFGDGTMDGAVRITLVSRPVDSKPFEGQIDHEPTLFDAEA